MDSEENEETVNDVSDSKYIIWFIEPDGAYCNQMISIIDEYRMSEDSLKVIGLSIKDGDLSKFNNEGESTFMLVNKDSETKEIVDMIEWIPTFIYIENGTIKLVTYGRMTIETLRTNIEVAFE